MLDRSSLAACAAWLAMTSLEPTAARASDAPNVIFILTDDQGYGDLASAGHPYLETPNIDRLAMEGTTFKQFYAASAICSPSRAAFVTGRFPAELGIRSALSADPLRNAQQGSRDYLDPNHPSIMGMFQDAGYRTGHVGKWHLGATSDAPPPEAYGLEFVRTMKCNGTKLRITADALTDDYKKSYFRSLTTEQMVDDAIEFMEASDGRPFLLNLWTLIPHAKLNPTPDELARYDGLRVRLRDFRSHFRSYLKQSSRRDEQMRTYCAAVTGLDQQIGRLLEAVDRLGIADRTIIVFASDNGPESYSIPAAAHSGAGSTGLFRGRKRSLHEGGIRVPFIMRWPGTIEAGVVNDSAVVGAVDLLPTLSALAGVPVPVDAALDGEDVSDMILGPARRRLRPLFWESRQGGPALAVRRGRWKLLVDEAGGSSLYRIDRDPREVRDLAAIRPWIVTRLRSQLDRWNAALP